MNGRDPGSGPPSGWSPRHDAWRAHRRHGPWRRGRGRFVRRIALALLLLLGLSAVGAGTLIMMLLDRTGMSPGRGPGPMLVRTVGPLALLVAVFLIALRRVGFPLGEIVEAAARVADGDFTVRVAERGPPSLRSVAHAFNSMTTRLAANEQQRRRLMSDVAHELRTPLAVIQARLEGLIDGIYPRDDPQLKALLGETQTLARLIEDVRTLANSESGALALHKEPTDLGVLLHDVAAGFTAADETAVRIRVDLPDLPIVTLDPVRIREVVANLLSNAVRHSPPRSVVAVSAAVGAGAVALSVADEGTGIAPEDLDRVFDRFYKSPGSPGSGLGLTIARSLVLAHGGDIEVASRPGRGTTMTVTIPTAEAVTPSAPER